MPIAKLNIPLPSKGVVVDRPGEFIDSRSAANNENLRFNLAVIDSRPGTSELGSTLSERVQRIFELELGSTTHLIRVGTTKVEQYNKATDVWADIANAALTGAGQDQVDFAFPLLSGSKIVTFTNGIDNIRKYTGAGNDADLGGSPPVAKYMVAFGGHLVLAHITNFPFRVQWSDTGLPETWAGGNSGSVDLLEDPEDITAISVYGNFITVHKRNSIYVGQLVTTSAVFRFDRKATGIGAIGPKAIQNIVTGDQVFMAADGIHIFNGITAPLIPSTIQEEIRDGLNPTHAGKADSIIKEEVDEVWFAVPIGSQTEPETVYKFNYRTNQIYKDSRPNLTTMGLYLNTVEDTWDDVVGTWDAQTDRWNSIQLLANNPVVAFGFSDGVTTRDGIGSDDNGVAVTAQFETKDFTAQDYGIVNFGTFMRWESIQLWAKGTDVTVQYSTDSGIGWNTIDSFSLSSDYPADDAPFIGYFDVVSTKIRFRFRKTGLAQTFAIKKYYIEALSREERR